MKKSLSRAIFVFILFWNSSSLYFLLNASPITYELNPISPVLPNFTEEIDTLIPSKNIYDEDAFENQIYDESVSDFESIEEQAQDFRASNLITAASKKEFDTSLNPFYEPSKPETDANISQSNLSTIPIFLPLEEINGSNLETIFSNEQIIAANPPKSDNEVDRLLFETFYKFAKLATAAYCLVQKQIKPTEETSGVFTINKNIAIYAFGKMENELTQELRKENSQMVDFPGVPGAKIHNGFKARYLEWESHEGKDLINGVESNPNWKSIYFIGYGLAGVYAEFAALYLVKNIKRSIVVETFSFGKPRIGNEAYAKHVNSLIPSVRFTNQRDNIPREPVEYKGENYVHGGTEFWDSGVNHQIIICARASNPLSTDFVENKNCIDKEKTKNPKDHYGPYFGVMITDCSQNNFLPKVPSSLTPTESFIPNDKTWQK